MLGQAVRVTLIASDPITGSLRFALSEFDGYSDTDSKRSSNRSPKPHRSERKRSTEQKFNRKKKRS
jgi:hypothetical protein